MKKMIFIFVLLVATISFSKVSYKDDPEKGIKEGIEKLTGIYTVNLEKRYQYEKVAIKGTTAEIWVWRTFRKKYKYVTACEAITWLLFGRGKLAKGAKVIFEKYPSLTKLRIVFFDIEFKTDVDHKKGKIKSTDKVIPYIKFSVNRKTALKLKKSKLAKKIKGDDCIWDGEKYLAQKWYKKGYY